MALLATATLLMVALARLAFFPSVPVPVDQRPSDSWVDISPPDLDLRWDSAETGVFSFTLLNRSASPVRIGNVTTTCGCTIVDNPEPHEIPPAGYKVIQVRISPAEYGDTSATITLDMVNGSQTRAARIPLILRGREIAVPYVISAPKEISAHCPSRGSISRTFQIRTRERRDEAPWIIGLTTSDPGVSARIVDHGIEPLPSASDVQRVYLCEVGASIGSDSIGIASARVIPKLRKPGARVPAGTMASFVRQRAVDCYPPTLMLNVSPGTSKAVGSVRLVNVAPGAAVDWSQILFEAPEWLALELLVRGEDAELECRVNEENHNGPRTGKYLVKGKDRESNEELFEIPLLVRGS